MCRTIIVNQGEKDMEKYVSLLKSLLVEVEYTEDYELCIEIKEEIDCIENNDIKTFIDINFDLQELTNEGMFKVYPTYEEAEIRINKHFGFTHIFEYCDSEIGMRITEESIRNAMEEFEDM